MPNLENVHRLQTFVKEKKATSRIQNPKKSFSIRLDKVYLNIHQTSNVARAAFYLGRKFGERAERKRKLTLRDETRRKREKEKKKKDRKG